MCSVWLLSQCLDIEFLVHKTSPFELAICIERQFLFWEIWNVLLWACTVCEFGGCDKKNVAVFCMAPAAKGGAAAWRFLLISTGGEPVVFPHALICDNKKEPQIVFFKHAVGLSVLRFASDSRCCGDTSVHPEPDLKWLGFKSTPCFGAGGGWAGLSNHLEPSVLLCSGCSAEGWALDVYWGAASLLLPLPGFGTLFVTSINFSWPMQEVPRGRI